MFEILILFAVSGQTERVLPPAPRLLPDCPKVEEEFVQVTVIQSAPGAPVVDTSPRASTCPPGVDCPKVPNSDAEWEAELRKDQARFAAKKQSVCPNCPNYVPPVPEMSMGVAVSNLPETVGDFDGDGREATRNDYVIHLRNEHGIDGSRMSLEQLKAAHLRVHGTDPSLLGSASTGGTVAIGTQSAPVLGTVYGVRNYAGQFRPYGSFRDGQGWWFLKLFGRPMPARRARRRGY